MPERSGIVRVTNCVEDMRNNKRLNQTSGERGEGISWMKKILRLRREK